MLMNASRDHVRMEVLVSIFLEAMNVFVQEGFQGLTAKRVSIALCTVDSKTLTCTPCMWYQQYCNRFGYHKISCLIYLLLKFEFIYMLNMLIHTE